MRTHQQTLMDRTRGDVFWNIGAGRCDDGARDLAALLFRLAERELSVRGDWRAELARALDDVRQAQARVAA